MTDSPRSAVPWTDAMQAVGRERRRALLLVTSLLAAAVALGGCSGGYNGARLSVAGDSITALEQPRLSTILANYSIAYVFRYGISIGPAVVLLRAELAADGRPGGLIENLGTNDALTGHKVSGPLPTLDPVVSAAAGIPCVVLTTISVRADVRGGSDVAASLNSEIARLHRHDPSRYQVVDWNGFVELLSPADFFRYIQVDQIHPTPLGAQWLAQSDAAALAACHVKSTG